MRIRLGGRQSKGKKLSEVLRLSARCWAMQRRAAVCEVLHLNVLATPVWGREGRGRG